MLDNTQIFYIKALQKASRQNKLVIFAGAGTSVDAGIPLWNTLIDKLTEVLPDEVKHNNRSDNLKLAELFREVSDDKDYYESIESTRWRN
jgi:NAD-dependent SIR2 family protein deacetylase